MALLKVIRKPINLVVMSVVFVLTAVFFIYIEPSFEYIKKDYNKNKIITLIDTSESMSLPVKSSNNRLSNIKYLH